MAIYRGPGGSGDAVNDAASEVLLALAAKDAAIAAQAAAEAAKTAAQLAETNAETAETNAETAETNAETAETNAETAQAAAASSASAASTSATNASNSASTATTQATNAASSASAASTSASNASSSASSASSSASTATTQATNASTSASSASTSATNAANSATSAATSATNAANSATLAASFTPSQTGNAGKYLKTDGTNPSWDALDISTADISGTLPIANGGTGATDAGTARTNLGLAIGTNVQAYDADLATIAGLTPTNNYAIIGNGTSWTSSALPASGVTSVTGTSPISSSGGATPAISLDNSGVSANTYGSSSSIPVITVSAKGLLTSVTTAAVAGGQYFGSAATKAIAYNSTTIAENITTTSGNNCLSVGPITINSGFSVTIASGQRWVIL